MASFHGIQRSSAAPSNADDIPRLRDACEGGTPPPAASGAAAPDNQPLPSQRLAPDASRDPILLALEVERALRLVDELGEYGLGVPSIGFHDVPRGVFDALPGVDPMWFAKTEQTAEVWSKALTTPNGQRVPFFTNEPPEDTGEAA